MATWASAAAAAAAGGLPHQRRRCTCGCGCPSCVSPAETQLCRASLQAQSPFLSSASCTACSLMWSQLSRLACLMSPVCACRVFQTLLMRPTSTLCSHVCARVTLANCAVSVHAQPLMHVLSFFNAGVPGTAAILSPAHHHLEHANLLHKHRSNPQDIWPARVEAVQTPTPSPVAQRGPECRRYASQRTAPPASRAALLSWCVAAAL